MSCCTCQLQRAGNTVMLNVLDLLNGEGRDKTALPSLQILSVLLYTGRSGKPLYIRVDRAIKHLSCKALATKTQSCNRAQPTD